VDKARNTCLFRGDHQVSPLEVLPESSVYKQHNNTPSFVFRAADAE
jgi:hypothetical protein